MARLSLILGILNFAFVVYALIDCFRTPKARVRALPKLLWAALIVIFPTLGAIIWFMLGKERLTPNARPAAFTSLAPDDDPAFLRKLSEDKQRDERIQELEAQLSELDEDPKNPKD
jgi:hypothetical protein